MGPVEPDAPGYGRAGASGPVLFGNNVDDSASRAQVWVGTGSSAAGGARIAVFDVVMEYKPDATATCTFQGFTTQSFTN